MSVLGSNCEMVSKMCVIKQHEYGAGEKDQRLRVLTGLGKNPKYIPSTWVRDSQKP